jgi:hypothetical protein
MQTNSMSQTRPELMEEYQYQPIESPDQLRMLELLPGQDDEPIEVKLSHRPLSDLPLCEALSYEWGSPTRDHEISCEGKTLRVTTNLLAALKRLRPTNSPPRLMWIDALCINQDDLAERSEQVELMADIYRHAGKTSVWIGEAPAQYALEALDLIVDFAKIAQRLKLKIFGADDPQLPATLEIRNGRTIQQVMTDASFTSLLDILISQTYFSRLWTLQEIALSSVEKTTVYFGVNSVPWRVFRDAIVFLDNCDVIFETFGERKANLFNVAYQLDLQDAVQGGYVSLISCIAATFLRLVTEPRDRVFGLLGIVDVNTRLKLSKLSYSTSLGRIFQAMTESSIREYEDLSYLRCHTFVIDSVKEPDIPSWVLWMDNDPLRGFMVPFNTSDPNFIPRQGAITISDSVMTCRGFILDTVVHCSNNLSKNNYEDEVLGIYEQLQKRSPTESKDPASAIKVLWQALDFGRGYYTVQQLNSFTTWIAKRSLEHMAFSHPILAQSSRLKAPAQDNLSTASRFCAVLEAEVDGNLSSNENTEIAPLVQQADFFDILFELGWQERMFSSRKPQGRNIYISERGYCGVGPIGDNSPRNDSPAIQVGDFIAILSTACAPVVLRRIDAEHFSLVGMVHVPRILEDPHFKRGISEDFQRFLIR